VLRVENEEEGQVFRSPSIFVVGKRIKANIVIA